MYGELLDVPDVFFNNLAQSAAPAQILFGRNLKDAAQPPCQPKVQCCDHGLCKEVWGGAKQVLGVYSARVGFGG